MRGRMLAVLSLWFTSRLLLAWLLGGRQAWVGGDVSYFDASLQAVGVLGLGGVLVEYPLPAVSAVAIPWAVSHVIGVSYGVALLVAVAAVDLVFTLLLLGARRVSRAGWWPVGCWLVAVPALGTTAFARFDLLPGVLVGCSILAVGSRPRLAAGCLAVATAVKLWPAVVAAPLLAAARRRGAVATFVAVGVAFAVATAALAGPARLVTPLTYQADRGLQIESVAATPAMLAWWARPETWTVAYAPSRAYEVTGPGVDGLLAVSTLATLLYAGAVVVGAALLAGLWRRRHAVAASTLVWAGLTGVLGFVVTGKVLSPQYLLWLLPLAAAGLAVADSPMLRRWTAGLLVATALTQVVFPLNYAALAIGEGSRWLAVLALVLRNMALVFLLALAAAEASRRLRDEISAAGSSSANPPAPRHADGVPREAATPTTIGAARRGRQPRPTVPGGRRRALRPPRGSRRP